MQKLLQFTLHLGQEPFTQYIHKRSDLLTFDFSPQWHNWQSGNTVETPWQLDGNTKWTHLHHWQYHIPSTQPAMTLLHLWHSLHPLVWDNEAGNCTINIKFTVSQQVKLLLHIMCNDKNQLLHFALATNPTSQVDAIIANVLTCTCVRTPFSAYRCTLYHTSLWWTSFNRSSLTNSLSSKMSHTTSRLFLKNFEACCWSRHHTIILPSSFQQMALSHSNNIQVKNKN